MSHAVIANTQFLDRYIAGEQMGPVLLLHEAKSVDASVNKQRRVYDDIIKAKIEVTGGDDWHDGAFRATDNEAKIVSQQMAAIAPFLGAITVDYPLETELRATLGSRIVVLQKNYAYPVDIIGFRIGYPENVAEDGFDDEVTGISLESPLAKAILGHPEGYETYFDAGGTSTPVRIERINQLVVQQYFLEYLDQ